MMRKLKQLRMRKLMQRGETAVVVGSETVAVADVASMEHILIKAPLMHGRM